MTAEVGRSTLVRRLAPGAMGTRGEARQAPTQRTGKRPRAYRALLAESRAQDRRRSGQCLEMPAGRDHDAITGKEVVDTIRHPPTAEHSGGRHP
jgi:hypothetical protein